MTLDEYKKFKNVAVKSSAIEDYRKYKANVLSNTSKQEPSSTLATPKNITRALQTPSNSKSKVSSAIGSFWDTGIGKAINTVPAALAQLGVGAAQGVEGTVDFITSIGANGKQFEANIWQKGIDEARKNILEEEKKNPNADLSKEKNILNMVQKYVDTKNNSADKMSEFVGKEWIQGSIGKPVDEFTDKYSYLPVKAGQVVKAVGNMLPAMAGGGAVASKLPQATTSLGKVGSRVATMLPFMAQAAGSNTEQALNEGADLADATKYGLASGALEGAIESISGGIGGSVGGKLVSSKLGKEAIERIAKNALGKFALRLADAGIDVAGEGFEEVLSTAINPLIQRMTYDKKAELATSEEMMQSFIDGTLASLLVKGGQAGLSRVTNRNNVNVQESDAQNQAQAQNIEQSNITLPNQAEMAQKVNMEQITQIPNLPTQKAQKTLQSAKIAGMTDMDMQKAIDLNNMLRSGANLEFYDAKNIPQGLNNEQQERAKEANGLFYNNTLWINKNSERPVQKILGHELTHYGETQDFINGILDSNLFYDFINKEGFANVPEYKKYLKEKKGYKDNELDSEMAAHFAEEVLFGNEKSINRLARENSTLTQKILNWLSDLRIKLVGTSQEKELLKIENMYRKALDQARNTASNTTDVKYNIKNIAEFDENEYNNIQEMKLSPKEYGKLAHIVDTDPSIKPGKNYVETSDATYVIYQKEYNDFKVVDKYEGGVDNDTIANGNIRGIDEARYGREGFQNTSTNTRNEGTTKSNDELLNGNKGARSVKIESNRNGISNKKSVAGKEPAFSMPEIPKGYTRLYRGLTEEYNKNYDKRKLDNSNGYESWTDNYDLAKAYGDNVYYIDVPTSEIKNDIIDNDSKSETYGDRNLIYFNDKPVGIKGKSGNEYMLYTDHDNYSDIEYKKVTETDKVSFSMPENEVNKFLEENSMELRTNGSLVANNLTDKQIKDLVKIYKSNGYEDVSTDYLVGALQRGSAFIPREVADVFIEKQLGYKPQYDTTKIYEDAEGNKLTKEQVEFYKDSAVRDIRGRLIPVYHRTDSEFYTFDKNASARHGKKYGQGFYFSISPENYGNREMKVYLNAKEGEFKYVPKQGYYIVQEPNQIKNVDNTNPTPNPDIRYSMNPVEVAKKPPNIESGLDQLTRTKRIKEGDSQSSFTKNINNQSIFDDKFKELALDDKNIKSYERISNKETLQEANDAINEQGQKWVDRFLDKPNGEMKATDIAGGFILMSRYQQTGDYESMIRVAEKLRKAGTQQGQTIQMFSVLGRMTPEGMTYYAQKELSKAYDEILKNKTQKWADEHADEFKLNEKDIEYIQRRVNQAARLPDGRDKYVLLGEIASRIQNKIPPQAGQGLKALARNSMLLNPKTMVRNILGNVVIVPNHIVSDFIGAGIDKAISKKTGVRTTGGFDVKALEGAKKGVYESFDDFRRKISTREMGGDRFEIGQGKNFYENHTGRFGETRNKINKALNGLDRVTGFLLETGDRPFYETWFINSLNNQMKLNNVTEPTAEMIEIATDEALQRTWQDNNSYTRVVKSVRDGLNKLNVKGYGLGDMVMPFVKTPANLTKAVIDFSPLGAINAALKTSQFNKDIGKGTATTKQQREVVKAWSQVITGTLGMAMLTALANAGVLTGGSDEDKDVRAFEQNILGIKPYSIKIGDKTYTYDWAQPLGTSAAMVADTVKSLKNAKDTEGKVAAILEGAQSGASVLLEQSFVSGIRNLFEEDNLINALIETGFNEASKFTPQFLSQLAQIQDDTARTSYVYNNIPQTALNKVKAKIPGLRQTLEPSVDVLGREVKTDNSVGNVMFNPANTAFARNTKGAEEMYRVYQATGDKATIAQVAPYYFNVGSEKIVLAPKQRTQYQKTIGKIASDGVENLLNNKAYKALEDTDKAEILKDLYSYGNAIAKSEASTSYLLPSEMQKIKDSGMKPEEYILLKYISNLGGTKKDDMYNSLISAGYSQKDTQDFLTDYKGYKFNTTNNKLPTLSQQRAKLPTLKK